MNSTLITPERGKVYVVKHSSGFIKARFVADSIHEGYRSPRSFYETRTTHHYVFQNLNTGRDIVIKSRVKIRREVTETVNQ